MKHKHHDVICAWAAGAKIQLRNAHESKWQDALHTPRWSESCEYRVKPEPKQLWARPYKDHRDGSTLWAIVSHNRQTLTNPRIDWVGPAVLVHTEEQ